MGLAIINGSAANEAAVDATPKALRGILYDQNGNVIGGKTDKSALVPGFAGLSNPHGGVLQLGYEGRTARLMRLMSDGALAVGRGIPWLYDSIEGAAVDTNKWIQTLATMTVTQATGVITFNAGASVAATVGAMHQSHRRFPIISRGRMVMRVKCRATAHFSNNLHEIGFGAPASATAASIADGVCWRKDGTGQWVPVISINGSETLGTPISNATFVASIPATDFFYVEVEVEETRAIFRIYTAAATLFNEQLVDFSTISGNWASTHLIGMIRTYNSGATGTAVQLLVANNSIKLTDFDYDKPWSHILSGMNYNFLTSPTAYTQLANWTNNTAPTTRALTNTAAAETTLGGLLRVSSIGGGNTDLIMFGFTNPTPYTFYCTGIFIPPPLNEVVAVATTATIFAYFAAFNSSAVSLATAGTYPPMRVALPGIHTAAVALAANALFSGGQIIWTPQTPVAVQPGRFLHIGCRELVGTATATETYLWAGVGVDGYFE